MKNEPGRKQRAIRLTIGVALAFVFMILMNFLANYLPLNGVTTAEISDRYYNIFTPAGYTFIIWGVIYIALAIWIIAIIWGIIRNKKRPISIISKTGYLFIASSVLNGVWIFTWHYDLILLSLIVMLALLLSLVFLYSRLRMSQEKRGIYLVPFSIYLGWITVATIANLATYSVATNWSRFGLSAEFWLTVLLLVILGVSTFMVLGLKDLTYGLVILWALSGIATARWTEFGSLNYTTAITIGAGVLLLVVYGRSLASTGKPEEKLS
jgi:hypothetical protein